MQDNTYTLSGTIQDYASKKASNGSEYIELRILDSEGKETTARAWDEVPIAQCKSYTKGDDVSLTIKTRTRDTGEGGTQTYRNIIGVIAFGNGGANPSVNPTLSKPNHNTPMPQPVQQASVGGIGQIDPNQMRIMRQSTLHYACVLMSPMIREFTHPSGNTLAPDIKGAFIPEKLIVDIMGKTTVELARKFLEYVISGEMPLYSAEDCYEPLNWPLPPSFVPRVKQESQTEPEPKPEEDLFESGDGESLGRITGDE